MLGYVVPLSVHDDAAREILRSNVADHQSLKVASLTARQGFIDFFTTKVHGRPEITPKAIEDAAIFMLLSVNEEFKKAALMQTGDFSTKVQPGVPIAWN